MSDLSDEEIDAIATKLATKLQHAQACRIFTSEEIETVKGLLKAKKKAVGLMLLLLGTFLVWILKDIYGWLVQHLHWGQP